MGNSQKYSENTNVLMGGENGAQICVQAKSGFIAENSITCQLCTSLNNLGNKGSSLYGFFDIKI